MRLGLMLLRRTTNPNGHIYRGKNRIVKKVFPEDLQNMRNHFEIEERNMFLLRHSFLTAEQSHGHSKSLNIHYDKFGEILKEQRLKFKKNVTLEERLGHLRHQESWES